MSDTPPSAQTLQQDGAEHGVAILGAITLLHAQCHALAVDVGDLEVNDFTGTQASAIGHLQSHLVLDVAGCSQQT